MRILIFLAFVAYASAASVLECTYGPSYWCSTIARAKQCGAVDHCISTVWSHQRVTKGDGEAVCDFCMGVVGEVKSLLLSNDTEGRIHDYLTKACALIPEPYLADKCNEIADHYEAELIKMIKAKVDPKTICDAMCLCKKSGLVDRVPHPDRPMKTIPLTLGNATDCADCKKFFGDIQRDIGSNATEAQLANLVKQNVCSQLGGLEAECNDLVDQYAPQLLQMLASRVDPSQICQALGLCSGDRSILMAMKLADSKLYKKIHEVSDSVACELCKDVMAYAENLIKSNQTQAEIENFIETELCAKLGKEADVCKQLVTEFGPVLFELLANELDPDTVCKAIGMCSEVESVVPAFNIRPATVTLLKSQKTTPIKQSPQCVLCEFVMQELEAKLFTNASEEKIIEEVGKACTYLPKTISSECTNFVNQYGPAIISMLVAQITPTKICTSLGLCTSANYVSYKRPRVTASPQCVLCEFIISKLDSKLAENATQQEIISALSKVCDALPATITQACKDDLEEYGPSVIALIVGGVTPDKVCTALGLCTSRSFVHKALPRSDDVCDTCTLVIQYVDSLLADNATREEVMAAVEKVCNFFPNDKSTCDNLIEQYGNALIDDFINLGADGVCKAIGLCKTPVTGNKCMLGPAYWCASPANAEECKKNEGSGALCTICQEVLAAAKIAIFMNSTQEEITQLIEEELCSKLGPLADACKALVKEEAPTIYKLLVNKLDPPAICTAIGFCSAAVKGAKPVMIGAQVVHILKTPNHAVKSASSGVECILCEFVLGELEKLVKKNSTETEIVAALDKVCSFLPTTIGKECDGFVKDYAPAIITLLLKAVSPKEMCTELGICSSKAALKVALKKEKAGSPITCEVCEFAMGYLENMLQSERSEAEVRAALDSLCGNLPSSISAECTAFVNQYSAEIIRLIVEELADPSTVCKELGLCTATKALPKVTASVECVLCEFIMSKLKSSIPVNATEAEIKAALESVCSKLPTTITTECNTLVEQYTDTIVKMLINKLDPSTICTAIGLCKATKVDLPSVKSAAKCDICEITMYTLDQLLTSKSISEDIQQALQKVCSILPSKRVNECRQLVQQYESFILKCIEAKLDPKLICKTLGLCKVSTISSKNINGNFTCHYCKVFVGTLQSIVSDKPTQKEVEDALLKVCSFLPTTMQSECDSYIDTYYKAIIQMFVEMKPAQVCSVTGLCSAQKKVMHGDWIKINPLQHSQDMQYGGHSKCMWGPAYWCASKENARRCQAEAHCRKHVWN